MTDFNKIYKSEYDDETPEELVIQPEPPSQGRLKQDVSHRCTNQSEELY